MGIPRFFVPHPLSHALVGQTIDLPEAAAHHALRALRLAVGDALTLFDGIDGEFAATLVRADRRGASVCVDRFDRVDRESPLALTLAQGIAANDAMDLAVRKATELGASAIRPLVTARSAPWPAGERGERRLGHWRQIAVAACEQCGRNRLPALLAPQDFGEWLAAWTGSGIVLAPDGDRSVAQLPRPAPPLALLVGPEGGFDAREMAAIRARAFAAVRVGPRVLRTETAAIAGLALLQASWGDWQ